MCKEENPVVKFGRGIALSLFSITLLIVAIFPGFMWYAAKKQVAVWNVWFILGAAVLGVLLAFVLSKGKKYTQKLNEQPYFYGWTLGIVALLTLVQQWTINQVWFVTGWDAYGAVQEAVSPGYYAYAYSYYPNNLAIVGIFRFLSRMFGKSDFYDAYLLIIHVGGLIVSLSCLLVVYAAKRMTGSNCVGYAVLALEGIFIILSPQCLIPYTDTYGMLAPALALFLYTAPLSRYVKAPTVTLVLVLGSFIKPNAIIVWIALVLVELFSHNWVMQLCSRTVSCVVLAVTILAGIGVGSFLGTQLKAYSVRTGTISDAELSMSAAHYLMMGWNEQGAGGYSYDDVEFSTSIETYEERVDKDFEVFTDRIRKMGPGGVVRQLVRKTLSNYADGSGSWKKDGGFFQEIKGENGALQALYGITDKEDISPYEYGAQLLWALILCGLVLQWLARDFTKASCVVNVALLGQSVFLLLFECRARYFIQFWPYFVLAAILGWQALARKFR